MLCYVGHVGGSQGVEPPNYVFGGFLHPFFVVFNTQFFTYSFLILVKKIGLLTNTCQCIRGF
jgi:hypothetical protein